MDDQFPKRLACMRDRARYSQRGAAKAVGVSKSSISNYETGKQQPSAETVLALCRLYNANPTYVLANEGMPEWTPGKSRDVDQRYLARWLRAIAAYLDRAVEEGKDLVGVVDIEAFTDMRPERYRAGAEETGKVRRAPRETRRDDAEDAV
jgi:DNA-binding XRE family transcriptional regulator